MNPESKNNRPRRCLVLFVMRWFLLGWLVPMLWLLRAFAETNESYWSGDTTKIYWHRDDAMTALREWVGGKLDAFFRHNVQSEGDPTSVIRKKS